MANYDTVSVALNSLKERGFARDFNIAFDKIVCSETNECLNLHEFEITEVYRFEGESNPSDEAVVYAVQSHDGKMKGALVNAYGIYADPMSDEMIKKLSFNRK
ncbi:MAG: phosphoribosylpyrophosphate synthetase [Bacteroidota bacterium]|nr:phosphoribosylpyrophosphate synthetase [Bacteroidota bacterium]